MTESAVKTAMRLGVDVRIASHIESRLKNPRQLEEAIRMFYAGTLPYAIALHGYTFAMHYCANKRKGKKRKEYN